MEEKFEWIDNGVSICQGSIFEKTFEKTIYDEGGCELTAVIELDFRNKSVLLTF